MTLLNSPLPGVGGGSALVGWVFDGRFPERAGGTAPGTPGFGATVRGPAASNPPGVSCGPSARHAGSRPKSVPPLRRPLVLPRPDPHAPVRPGPPRSRLAARTLPPLAVVLLGAACGTGPPATRPAAAGARSPAATGTYGVPRAAVTPAPPGAPTAPAAARPPAATGTSARGDASRRTSAPAEPPPSGLPSSAPLRVELAATCLVPGARQRLVVETLPHAFVAFDNLYPDDRTGAVHGGAEARGRADGTGRFTAAWRVAPDTPTGRVRVDVGVSAKAGSAISMAYYRLAARCA